MGRAVENYLDRELWMMQRIQSGFAHIESGRLHSNEEAFAKMDKLARAIAKKTNSK